MVYTPLTSNAFEFAVVVALRAKQLTAGCAPRVPPGRKFTITATLEVLAGKVARLPEAEPKA